MPCEELTVEPVRNMAEAHSAIAVDNLIFKKPTPTQFFSLAVTRNDVFILYLAKNKQEITGYSLATVVKEEAEIISLGVLPCMRNMGIGVALISSLVETATKRGAQRLLLEVRPSNNPAIALYRSTGFKTVAVRRKYYRNPSEDALVMSRPLETEIPL